MIELFLFLNHNSNCSSNRATLCFYSLARRGNKALFKAARKTLLLRYPELSPEALPMHMMEWAQMIERDRAIARAAAQLGK